MIDTIGGIHDSNAILHDAAAAFSYTDC